MLTTLDLIRHGTPEGGNRYRGHSIDDPLSASGWQQMQDAVKGQHDWQQVISSPMHRCLAFAESYANENTLPLSTDERLVEIGFGDWEGRTSAEILADDPDAIKNFYRDPVNNQPNGAESLRGFSRRVHAAISDILQQHAGKNILVVAHAGVMRAAICSITMSPLISMYRLSIGNAAIIRIRDDGIRPPTIMLK